MSFAPDTTYAPAWGRELPFGLEWLRRFGAKTLKGERKDVRVLANGRVEVVIEYPSLGDALAVLADYDDLKAMVREDQRAGREEVFSGYSRRPRARRSDV